MILNIHLTNSKGESFWLTIDTPNEFPELKDVHLMPAHYRTNTDIPVMGATSNSWDVKEKPMTSQVLQNIIKQINGMKDLSWLK